MHSYRLGLEVVMFDLGIHLPPDFLCTNSEGSEKTAYVQVCQRRIYLPRSVKVPIPHVLALFERI